MSAADAWTKYLEERDPASREQLIIQHTPLVKYVIGRLAIHLPQVLDFDDLLGYGTLGLIQAFERFDPSRVRKSTRLNSSHVNISYVVFCLKQKHPSWLIVP